MKKVFVIERHEYCEEGSDQRIVSIHKTLEGAIERFKEAVWNERASYIYNASGSTDTDAESMKDAGVEELLHEDPDGTRSWHIWMPTGWDEVFIHIYQYSLYE